MHIHPPKIFGSWRKFDDHKMLPLDIALLWSGIGKSRLIDKSGFSRLTAESASAALLYFKARAEKV